MKASVLGQGDEAQFLQFVECVPNCGHVDQPKPVCAISDAKIETAIVATVIEHGELDKQGASRWTQRAVGRLVEQVMAKPYEAPPRHVVVTPFLVRLVLLPNGHGKALPGLGSILRTETGRPFPAALPAFALSVRNDFDDGHG